MQTSNPFNKCGLENDRGYHMPTFPKFSLIVKDCQLKVINTIEGQMNLSLICDLLDTQGEDSAKTAWWEYFLWIKKQIEIQDSRFNAQRT